jgi:hypothetical protein
MNVRRWKVTAPWNYNAIAFQSGTPVNVLHAALGGSRDEIGFVEAPTKGAAIVAAHQHFPKIPVNELLVTEVPA